MIAIFSQADLTVTRSQVSDWLKKEDNPDQQPCEDKTLAYFLNGLINELRGKKEGAAPEVEDELNNNIILMKLRIALDLRAEDVLGIMRLADFVMSKPELSAFSRKKTHKHYRVCKDQILRNFIRGIEKHLRPDIDLNADVDADAKWPGRT
jgi:uncharacterized protein YehS (DUF1456 family)